MKRRGWVTRLVRRLAWPLTLLACPAAALAQCGPLASAANFAIYGRTSLSVTGTVSNGTSSNTISGSGKALNQASGVLTTPTAPTFPALFPASFPANASVTDTSATSLSPGSYRTVTAGSTTAFSAGTYYINRLSIGNSDTVNLGAGSYYIGTLNMGNGAIINVSSGTVRIYIGTLSDILDGNKLNVGGTPAAFQVFIYPGADVSRPKDNNEITGLIYSPGSAISFAQGTKLVGAVIGTTVSMGSSSAVTYTPAVQAAMSAISTCPLGAVDHYELSMPSTAVACLSSTVTVTACANNSSPCTLAATTLDGRTATLATSAGTLGNPTVTFNAAGVATTTLSHTAAAHGVSVNVTLSSEQTSATHPRQCCVNGTACSVANSCSTTFNTAGFIVAADSGGGATTVPAQTAGTASVGYFLRAVQSNTATKACEAALTGVGNVNWSYQCNNPSTCSAGNLMTVTGNAAVLVAGNAHGSTGNSTAVAMTFDANGNAPFTFNFADVGLVTLNASRAAGGTLLTALVGASNAFVARPARFVLSNIKQTAAPQLVNPAAANAAGSRFIKAGEAFTATVTARTSGGAITPNYGRETAPEGVLLTLTLVLPAGGASGTLNNASIAGGSFTAGVATAGNLAFSEVGIITLSPAVADGDYLGAGPVTGASTGHIGRFFPARFGLGSGGVTNRSALSCAPASAFSYLGENFRLGLTLTAQNTAGATTANYTGSFAKLDPASAAWNLAGRDATTVFTVASERLALGSASGGFINGVASGVMLTANATRAAAPDGPFNAAFGVAPVDSDGVAMVAFDLASTQGGANDRRAVATVALRFGRLRLGSAAGAADRAMALPVTVQHWNGSAFDTHTLDSCTQVATTAMSFGNLRGTLTTADTAASAAVTLGSGVGTLRLVAPGGGRSGTYDVALSLGGLPIDASCLQPWAPGVGDAATAGANLAFLRGNFCAASFGNDPAARATFGRQRGMDNLVYRRENF